MQYVKSIRRMSVLGLLAVLPVACVYDPVYYGPPGHTTVRPGFYEPWEYYYYPDVQVYFHYSTGFYFYFDNGIWIRTRILPPRFHLNPRARIHLHIENERPYLFHHQHVEKYRNFPRYRWTPELDRRERDYHRERYESQRHRSAPPVQTRPSPRNHREQPVPRYPSQSRPRYEEHRQQPAPPPRDPNAIQQYRLRVPFDQPAKSQPQRHERQEREQGTRFDSPPQHQPIPLVPGKSGPNNGDRQNKTQRHDAPKGKPQKTIKQQQRYEKQYEEQEQQQEGTESPRSNKERREEERERRYR